MRVHMIEPFPIAYPSITAGLDVEAQKDAAQRPETAA